MYNTYNVHMNIFLGIGPPHNWMVYVSSHAKHLLQHRSKEYNWGVLFCLENEIESNIFGFLPLKYPKIFSVARVMIKEYKP